MCVQQRGPTPCPAHRRVLLPPGHGLRRPQADQEGLAVSTHSLLSVEASSGRKEGNVLFNDALNAFYLRLYGVRHMVKDHSESERGKREREMFYLTTHSTHFIYGYMVSDIS